MVDRYGRVKLTNPDKVLYPATGTTKAEVFDYYIDIAEAMLPHIAGRPVTRKRWPNGVDEPVVLREATRERRRRTGSTARSITHRSGTTTYPIIDTRRGIGVDRAAGRAGGARAAVAVRGQASGAGEQPGPGYPDRCSTSIPARASTMTPAVRGRP